MDRQRALELATRIANVLRQNADISEAVVYQHPTEVAAAVFISIPQSTDDPLIHFVVDVRPLMLAQ